DYYCDSWDSTTHRIF
nr:immunoglobulin light chain junction region [Macaca mulatta]MOV95277.1 immunoglobulin light chain junction region [Macaca mulatta]MOV95635.1 immunoglobulin light chain junction region [Macaca mulatta]MOV97738.1 immunoglobulin light chain junction region [Macaca mulatta]MOV99722.1 immunoglobulin light chain junction region [Macaca mulatta]